MAPTLRSAIYNRVITGDTVAASVYSEMVVEVRGKGMVEEIGKELGAVLQRASCSGRFRHNLSVVVEYG